MTKLSLYLVTMLLGTHFPSPTAAPVSAPPIIVAQAVVSADEQRLVDLANTERRSRGLQELRVNMMLVRIAREHSREMCERDYFDHASPTPGLRTPKDRYLNALGRTPDWACIAENIFYSSVTDPDLGHKCLMQSPPHRQNILGTEFDQVGVGVYEAPDGRFWVTQVFLTQIG
jgi:uncharacterized protein YkwD